MEGDEMSCAGLDPEAADVNSTISAECLQAIGLPCNGSFSGSGYGYGSMACTGGSCAGGCTCADLSAAGEACGYHATMGANCSGCHYCATEGWIMGTGWIGTSGTCAATCSSPDSEWAACGLPPPPPDSVTKMACAETPSSTRSRSGSSVWSSRFNLRTDHESSAGAPLSQQSSSPCTPAQSNAFEYDGCCYQCGGANEGIRIDNGQPKCVVAFANLNQGTDPTSNDGSSTCITSGGSGSGSGGPLSQVPCSAPSGMFGYAYNGCCYYCSSDTAPNGVEFQDGVLKCSPGSHFADIMGHNGASTCLTNGGSGSGYGPGSGSALAPTGVSAPTATSALILGERGSASLPTITDCPGTPGMDYGACGCDIFTHGEAKEVDCESSTAGCTDGRVFQCFKCPDGAHQWQNFDGADDENRPMCYTCPPDQPEFGDGQCYGIDVATWWQVMKCDDGGTLTDAVAAGGAPTTSNLIVSECPISGSFDACGMEIHEMEAACGCSGSASGSIGLFDATGQSASWSGCTYKVEGGEWTNTVPDGFDWRCGKCPDGMQIEFPTSLYRPTCMGCPPGVYPSMRVRVRMRVCRVNVLVCFDENPAWKPGLHISVMKTGQELRRLN